MDLKKKKLLIELSRYSLVAALVTCNITNMIILSDYPLSSMPEKQWCWNKSSNDGPVHCQHTMDRHSHKSDLSFSSQPSREQSYTYDDGPLHKMGHCRTHKESDCVWDGSSRHQKIIWIRTSEKNNHRPEDGVWGPGCYY